MKQANIVIQFLIFALLLSFIANQSMYVSNGTILSFMIKEGVTNQSFINRQSQLGCSMPDFYIYQDYNHKDYKIISTNLSILSVNGKYEELMSQIVCKQNSCEAIINNQCPSSGKNAINLITVVTQQTDYQYLINCFPLAFYKPFQWGLFILLIFCTITITLSSLYSKAWSYGGIGLNISYKFIVGFNLLVIAATVAAFLIPQYLVFALNVIGSLLGTLGVMVCINESIWLLKKKCLSIKVIWKIRIIDLISFGCASLLMIVFWIVEGNWILNDVFAMCTIIASIKIFKIRAFKDGIVLVISLLLIQIVVGLFVHYILKVSYNNLIINKFQSPIVAVLPSITPELYHKCAWLPITALIFPGLILSYLRRFDQSRSTFLYLLIGYISFYVGGIIWMAIDMSTVHSLPFAIISQPVTIIIVIGVSYRRNELTTLWGGFFYDKQLPQMSQQLLPSEKQVNSDLQILRIQQMTSNLKIQNLQSSDDMHQVYIKNKQNEEL